jgi:hypothetical protein
MAIAITRLQMLQRQICVHGEFSRGVTFGELEHQPIDEIISSWATYNLLNACTACQGFDQSITKCVDNLCLSIYFAKFCK